MSWHDADGPWCRAQRKRVRKALLNAAVSGAVPVILCVIATVMLSRTAGVAGGWSALRIFVPVLVALGLFSGAIGAWLMRIELRVLREVPRLNGRLCPKCRREMEVIGDAAKCAKCRWTVPDAALIEFWQQFPHMKFAELLQRLRAVTEAASIEGSGRRWQRRLGRHPLVGMVVGVGIWLVFMVGITVVMQQPLIPSLIRYLPHMALMAGVMLVAFGRVQRKGDSRHCAQCGYEMVVGGAGERCPECGTDWSGPGGVVHGRPRRSPRLIAAGVVLFLLGFGSLFTGFRIGASIMPTGMLISSVTASGGGLANEWTTLSARTLTTEQELELFDGLLEKRRRRGYLTDGEPWLTGMIGRAAVPPDRVDRFYAEMLAVQAVNPAQAKTGATVTIDVLLADSGSNAPGMYTLLYVDGVYVGDDPEPRGRPERPIVVMNLPNQNGGSFPRIRRWTPGALVMPDEPGPLRVRIALWHVVGNFKMSREHVSWNDDGSLQIPSAATWSRRIEIEHVIDVTAPSP